MDEVRKVPEDRSLGRNFSFFSLPLFVLPSVFSLVFIAAYQTVDGVFIEMFEGDIAIAAVNLFSPVLYLLVAFGVMLGTGGNAMIVKYVGENNPKKASHIFSQVILLSLLIGILSGAILLSFAEPIMRALGASDINIVYLRPYYMVLCAGAVFIILQTVLGTLMVGEGRSTMGAVLIMLGGGLNCLLDFVFMKYCGMGIQGAAIATIIGYAVPVAVAVVCFYDHKTPLFRQKSTYHLRPTRIRWREMGKVCFNGSSEMVSNLSGGITALIMNHLIFDFRGELGVSALSVVLYFQFFVVSVFMGFSMAVEPVFSFHYGSGNTAMRKKVFRLCLIWIAMIGVILSVVLYLLRDPIVGIFFDKGTEIYDMTMKGFLFAIPAALFTGFSVFASSLFTAFSNGLISALLSTVRTLVVLVIALFVLSALFGENGLWASWTVTEILCCFISLAVTFLYRKRYGYGGKAL